MIRLSRHLALFAFVILFTTLASPSVSAQKRDYLTPEELELVRDAQELDLRIKVLNHATDRRFSVLFNEKIKEKEVWGPLPQGTRLQLLIDIDKLVQKAVDDIDDVAARNRTNKLLPKALGIFTESCRSYGPKLKSLLDATTDQKERSPIIGASANCEAVIEAAAGLANPEK